MFQILFWLTTSVVIFLLFEISTKIHFNRKRQQSQKLKAIVVEYRKMKVPIRNDFTKMDYPFVKILEEGYDDTLYQLRYADSWKNPFEIGERVDVFWLDDKLVYWYALDRGMYKYLPDTWSGLLFWKK